MRLVSDYVRENGKLSFIKEIRGKNIHFKTDKCEFFPNFDITGKALSTEISSSGEIICKVRIQSKIITVGTNMRGLEYEVI